MGLRDQSFVGCLPEFVFQFSVAQVFVGLRKQFRTNLVFPLEPVLLVLITIIENILHIQLVNVIGMLYKIIQKINININLKF